MRRAGQGSQRDAPRPGNRRVVLFTAMVAIALGGVVLLGLYATGHWRPNRPSADAPGHVTTELRHPGAQTLDPEPSQEPRGGTADAAAPEIPLAALDRRIALLALTGSLQDETLRDALAEQVAHRLMHALVTSDGQRRLDPTSPRSLGLPPGDSKQVALDTAADLLAERVLLAEALPEQARALLTPLPVEAPDSPEALSKIPATALHVIIAPKSALAQEIHIRAMGQKKAWKMPHATNDGRRYVFPHLLVARDAVQRLAELEPGNALGQALRRYLEAQPRGEPGGEPNRGGGLVARLTGVKRVPVKKAPHVKLDLTLELRNAEGQNPVTLEPALWRLHGIGTEPLLPAYWEPEQAKSLAGGEIFTLTLTFAEPLGAPSPALVLSVARPGGGALWLQVESLLIP